MASTWPAGGSSPPRGRSTGAGWCSRSAAGQRLRHPRPGPAHAIAVLGQRRRTGVGGGQQDAYGRRGRRRPEQQRRLATVVVGGGGATGVELAGELAEILPKVASAHGLAADRPAVQLVEAGPAILAGSSAQLIDKATRILSDLGVQVRTNATIAAATEEGFRLTDGQLVEGGVFVWAGGLKAPGLVADSELLTGHNGRVKVDRYLRVLDHPQIYVAGDLASVTDPRTGHALPPLAQVALEEGETVARNLDAELEDKPLEAFTFRDKGFVVSVGTRRGVADIAGITTGGRLAHGLKDAIEWEYRQSVKHLRGWDPL